MQLGCIEGGANVRYVAGPERLSAQNRAEQIVHHPFGVGDIMRGGVVDRIREIRIAAIEVTVAEVVVPDAVLRDQVTNAVAPRCLAELRGDAVNGEQADLVAVTEVPDGVNNGKAVVRVRVGLGKIAAAVLGDRNEWLTWSDRLRRRRRARPELLHEVPVTDIREIIDTEAIDVVLACPELAHVQEEIAGGEGTIVRQRVKPEQVLAEVLAAIGAAWHGEPVKRQHGQRARG